MDKTILLSLIIGLILGACTEPNIIGLEVHPESDRIIVSDTSSFEWQEFQTETEEPFISTQRPSMLLGEIYDPVFGVNRGSFYTQILLSQNNINLGDNPIVDSVILSYTYSGYYGDLVDFIDLEVNRIYEDIHKDSIYYSNSFQIGAGSSSWVEAFSLSNEEQNPRLKIILNKDSLQQILDLGDENLKDNETFLEHFQGISILAHSTNTMLYLNPNGSNSFLKIYYHNDANQDGFADNNDTLLLNFDLGGDAARISLFNTKSENSENTIILNDQDNIYIESMAGYKAKISIQNKTKIDSLLAGKTINKVIMSFDVEQDSQTEYLAHDYLVLVRVDQDGEVKPLIDYSDGDPSSQGRLEDDRYEFNITRYFYELLNNDSYTNDLYLESYFPLENSNRTILDKDVKLQIYYSEL